MAIINDSIPNLVNGISQQSPSARLKSQGEVQLNGYSSIVEGLKKRPPTVSKRRIIPGEIPEAFMHTINRDVNERYEVVITQNSIRVFDLEGNEKVVNCPNGTAYLNDGSPATAFRAVTVADHTFIVNTHQPVFMSAEQSPTPPSDALIYIRQGNYATNYIVWLKLNGQERVIANHLTDATDINTIATNQIANSVALQMFNNLEGLWQPSTAYVFGDIRRANGNRYFCSQAGTSAAVGTGPSGTGTNIIDGTAKWDFQGVYEEFGIGIQGSTILLRKINGTDFDIKVADSNGDKNMVLVKRRIQRFSDLPNVAPKDFVVEVAGDVLTEKTSYWVRFTPSNATTVFDRGTWSETVAPSIPIKFLAASMPHLLVRESDGTFTFREAEWDSRPVGDETTCPNPSFVGRTISDVFFYRNRLGFFSGENVIFSRAGEYFNFWRSTVTAILDTDPVDVAVTHTKVSILEHAVSVSEKLFLFSNQTQFVLDSKDLLTPKTVSIPQTTEFECNTLCKPVAVGTTIYFVVPRGEYSGISEYFVDTDTRSTDAADVTAHVPSFIPKDVFKIAAAPNENLLVLLTKAEPNAMYVYKYFWNGDEKLQSSWSKWSFGEEGVRILDANFIDMTLFMVVQREDGVYLESMDVEPRVTDPGLTYQTFLDRRISEADCGVTYDDVNNVTFWTLPYSESGIMGIVTRFGGTVPPGVWINTVRVSNSVLSARGDWRSQPVYLGRLYDFRYRFSPPMLKQQNPGGGEVAIVAGRLQVQTYTILHADTGYYRVEVTPQNGHTYSYPFTGRILGTVSNTVGQVVLETGDFTFPVRSQNDRVTIEVVNDSPLPCKLQSAEWTAQYVSRSRRV